jgi:hypothetical protein
MEKRNAYKSMMGNFLENANLEDQNEDRATVIQI